MLCEQVRRVFGPLGLLQFNGLASDLFLHPQTLSVDVAKFAEAAAATHPHARCGVRPQPQGQGNAEVF